MDTTDGFSTQFFRSMMRPVRLITITKFKVKLIDKAKIKPNIKPGIPNFGTIRNTNNIRVP